MIIKIFYDWDLNISEIIRIITICVQIGINFEQLPLMM
jgi:hypothetical protein